MRNWLKVCLTVLPALSGCTDDAFSKSEFETRRVEIYQNRSLDDIITDPDAVQDFNAERRRAAYEMVEGLSAQDAIATFASDGADCVASTCSYAWEDREPIALLIYPGIRNPGPLRRTKGIIQITILTPSVQKPDDLDLSERWWSEPRWPTKPEGRGR